MHRKPKPGDVIQIALPNGTFAYGRVLKEGVVAFYRKRSGVPLEPPIGSTDFEFIVGVYSDVVKRDDVPIVGNDSLANGWGDSPPPFAIRHPEGTWSLYQNGQISPSDEETVGHLERAAAWDLDHIVDRLMGSGAKWLPPLSDR